MKENFWDKLKKPIFVLAPMADVTDVSFRRVIAKYGKPDVMWTEFVSADGLVRATPEGKKKLLKDLEYSEGERPIVAQLFSANPEYMFEAAKLVKELGFDGLDINMGCPDKGVEKQGAGAALMKNSKLAREIIRSAKNGFDGPVSVKTRIGYNKDELDVWLPEILKEGVSLVTIHARTRKEMSDVPANWERVKRAVEIRNEYAPETLIFGNGDVAGVDDARKKCEEFGCDGVMLGRAIFGNPWLFMKNPPTDGPTTEEKLKVLVEHSKLYDELITGFKSFSVMKKHFKAYVNGFDGAVDLRKKLMETNNSSEVEMMVNDFLKK
ncbi:MAG: tRNA-dihydrouridine synthase family protein [Minisyncoccia bacterium]